MSIVWDEDTGGYRPVGRPKGLDMNSRAGTVLILVLFAAAAMVLAAAAWRSDGGDASPPAPQPAAQPETRAPADPVAPTAARVSARPLAPPQMPLPQGSARFSSDIPAPPAALAVADEGVVDGAATASVPPGGVAVAETEADVVAMEAQLAAAGDGAFAAPADADLVSGRALKWVNLRAGPDNGTEVLAVVPFDAEIRVRRDCEGWCAVTWDGRQGYIYRSLIRIDG